MRRLTTLIVLNLVCSQCASRAPHSRRVVVARERCAGSAPERTASQRRGRPPLLDERTLALVRDWLSALDKVPSESDIENKRRAIVAATRCEALSVVMLTEKLHKHRVDVLSRFINEDELPRIDLSDFEVRWRKSEERELHDLLNKMPRTDRRLIEPLLAGFNAVRRRARVKELTYEQVSKKCSKMRERQRKVRSGEAFEWPTLLGARERCV